ncbi:MAG TPA: type I-E CRISPR-associated protein Cse1/CasA [Mycobacterium sp.]
MDEGWIQCLTMSGESVQWSVRQVLARAAEIRTIEAELPTVTFAIHRLLAAILYRALAFEGEDSPLDAWKELWREPDLPMDMIEDYLAQVQHRFDLLHPVAPFYQVAELRTAKNEFSGLERIIADVPNGSPYFTIRAGDRLASIDLAEAARCVVHCQAFDPSGIKSGAVGDARVKGGKGYPIGTGWAGGIGGVLIEGDNLRETLLLNLALGRGGKENEVWSVDADLPVWEREAQSSAEDAPEAKTGEFLGRPPHGPADLLTWQSRRIRLRIESGRVTGVLIANGDVLWPQNRYGAEPMTGWRHSEPQSKKYKSDVYMPRQHDPDRAVWRGLGAILPDAEAAGGTADREPGLPVPNLLWLRMLQQSGGFDDIQVRIRAIGMVYGSNNSVVDDIYDDALRVHSILLAERPLQEAALEAVARADRGVYALSTLARNLDVAAGGNGAGARSRARTQGYFALDAAYRDWVARLAPGCDGGIALADWTAEAREVVRELADREIESTSPAAWRGRHDGKRHVDVGLASRWFTSELNKVLPVPGSAARERQGVS